MDKILNKLYHEIGDTPPGEIHPQIQKILQELKVSSSPGSEKKDYLEKRNSNSLAPYGICVLGAVHVMDRVVESNRYPVPIRIYRPDSEGPLPILFYFHGGCWVFCSLDSHDNICRSLAVDSGCVVISVGYRLAPEYKYPTGIDDAYQAVKWCLENANSFSGDPHRVAVAGDSAGGNIAAVTALRARERNEFEIHFQALIYPITDISTFENQSYHLYEKGYFFTKEDMLWTSGLYIENDSQRVDPDVSPLLSHQLEGLPPVFMVLAELDVLKDEGLAYAEKLIDNGVEVNCRLYRGMTHAFVAMAGAVDLGAKALADCSAALKSFFNNRV